MASIYCGADKVPKNHRRGNMKECAEKGQIRYYGIEKVDTKILEAVKKKENPPETREKLMIEIAKERGTIDRYKGRYEKAPKHIDKTKLAEYYDMWKKAEKRYKLLVAKFKKLDAKDAKKVVSKKTKSKDKH